MDELTLHPNPIHKHTQQGQEWVVISKMVLGIEDDDKEFHDAERSDDGLSEERVARLYRAEADIRAFIKSVEQEGRLLYKEEAKIKQALALTLLLHINQPDRADGTGPYVQHPIDVARGILATYREDDVADECIAALLHDSVEDHPALLALLKKYSKELAKDISNESLVERSDALRGLGELFGPRVQELVETLSKPAAMKDEGLSSDEKYEMYLRFVQDIVNSQDTGPFAIKWQDAVNNMLTVGGIWRRAQHLKKVSETVSSHRRKQLLEQSASAEEKYIKQRDKYEPVLKGIFLPAFENMKEGHPMYKLRDGAIRDINTALETEYDLDS